MLPTSQNNSQAETSQQENSFTVSPPAINLPKGGGAIRGIGEKFAANPVTGTGSMTISIASSPGRSGFGPQLNLSYDSGSGNGLFGFGWSLSLPSITRKTDKGIPLYDDSNESDVFILSGAEDLVPVYRQDPDGSWVSNHPGYQRDPDGFWVRDQEGRLVLHEDELDEYRVRRYRPRIEGLFARIERWTNSQGDVHWRSISKDNILTLYGKDDNSRIYDPKNSQHIFSWLICETRDDKGNAIIYEYRPEDGVGVDLSQVHERNRGIREDTHRTANRYLKHIRYGNRQPLLVEGNRPRFLTDEQIQEAGWMFEVVFDFGEGHCEKQPLDPNLSLEEQHQFVQASLKSTRDWPVRQDPFSSYRAGFEVRSYRLCRRVLMFHHFPNELSTDDYLVWSTEFTYLESPIASFITNVTPSGYVHKPVPGIQNRYLKKSLPPLEFEYSQPIIHEEVIEVDPESLGNLPYGLDGTTYQWVDLDGEGLSGVLTEQGGAWYYKPNLSPTPNPDENSQDRIKARFGPLQRVAEKPSLANLGSGGQQFLDLAGDGQLDLATFAGPTPGFYERTQDESWATFRTFPSLPNLDWNDPNLRFVDLTGDGHADILITEDEVFNWHLSLAEAGFAPREQVQQALDEEKGPRLVFADGTQSIYLTDFSGDNLIDLGRIRNGEICYWPNLGYGRFGAKVTMDNSPWFDAPDQFAQQRVRLADIDGSGTTDIIYLGCDSIDIYRNQAGNSWSAPESLTKFPKVDNLSSVMAVDLLGIGTACLVWSSPLPNNAHRPMRYIVLMEEKPHLLTGMKNNLGMETRVHYASSTKFYLSDKRDGKPWITRLPFPVHVVERMETYDHISRNRFVTRYEYHHGYFDGEEREFRGFARVDQWDTEEIGTLNSETTESEITNWDEASFVPPVLTRTWFHTGAFIEGRNISKQFEHEYYHEGDPSRGEGELSDEQLESILLPDTVLPDNLTTQEIHEAGRSLKGGILRQEVYALDNNLDGTPSEKSDRPYSVSERNYTIKRMQPKGSNKHAVFFTHERETIDFHYERELFDVNESQLADPRIRHTMNLELDGFGNVLRALTIGYQRRYFLDFDEAKQKETHITLTANRFANRPDETDWYRISLPVETRTFEIVKPPEPTIVDSIVQLFKFVEMASLTSESFPLDEDEPDVNIIWPYEKWDWRDNPDNVPDKTYLRLIEHVRTYYRSDDLERLLDLGELQSQGLPGQTYNLTFSSNYFETKFINNGKLPRADVDRIMGEDGGYVHTEADVNWWIPSGRIFYAPSDTDELTFAQEHFYLPHRFRNPFGNETNVTYDSNSNNLNRNHNLLIVETQDALDNIVTVKTGDDNNETTIRNDYRVLQPYWITDPNGNRTQVKFDALGMVVATAVMGKVGENVGDFFDVTFNPDLELNQLQEFVKDPRGNAPNLLKTASTRIIYDLDRYQRCGQPPFAATLAREIHSRDPSGDDSPVQIRFGYSDGFGREIQTKVQAEAGDAPQRGDNIQSESEDIRPGELSRDDAGKIIQADTAQRWVGTGRTVYNNKGKPIKKYEPFFSSTHLYEREADMTDTGVTPVLFYDPVERVVATLHPNRTYEKVVFDPWQQKTYDVNDTLKPTQNAGDPPFDPKNDPDVGVYFQNLPVMEYLPTWYDLRTDPEKALQEWPDTDANGDPLPDNADRRLTERNAALKAAVHADTPAVAHLDTLGRTFITVEYNKFKRVENSAEKIIEEYYITRLNLDIEGNQREVIDAKNRVVMHYDYDMLGNRIHQSSMDAGERWMLNDVAGKPIRTWDSKGFARKMTYDELQRPMDLIVTNENGIERLAEQTTYGESQGNGSNLRGRVYQVRDGAGIVTNELYDFKGNLQRSRRDLLIDQYQEPVNWNEVGSFENYESFFTVTDYDALNRPISIITPDESVYLPTFNEANLLDRVDVRLRGSGTTTPFVANINYNAKGQRKSIHYPNGVVTKFDYDKKTFRLINLTTTRSTDGKQLQNLSYAYDPVGNITEIRDDAHQSVYFNNSKVAPHSAYVYDAIYRLIQADGREHAVQNNVQRDWSDFKTIIGIPFPNSPEALQRYTEEYVYDEVGNISSIRHVGGMVERWTRRYDYATDSNRLLSTSVPGDPETGSYSQKYHHDAHGNMDQMSHLETMSWDFKDQLQSVDLIDGGTAYYVYDASGQRVRKVIHNQNGKKTKERIYLGGFENYREFNAATELKELERETLHVMDDKQRIALVETRTQGADTTPKQLIRYQFSNHLGTACLETDEAARVISYEEYHPYGTTAYQATDKNIKAAAKRYRYTGKERDGENGLYYHGARYYSPWLVRWVSCDSLGLVDGTNLYVYGRNEPLIYIDSTGAYCDPAIQSCIDPTGPTELEESLRQSLPEDERYLPTSNPFTDSASYRSTGKRSELTLVEVDQVTSSISVKDSETSQVQPLHGTAKSADYQTELQKLLNEMPLTPDEQLANWIDIRATWASYRLTDQGFTAELVVPSFPSEESPSAFVEIGKKFFWAGVNKATNQKIPTNKHSFVKKVAETLARRPLPALTHLRTLDQLADFFVTERVIKEGGKGDPGTLGWLLGVHGAFKDAQLRLRRHLAEELADRFQRATGNTYNRNEIELYLERRLSKGREYRATRAEKILDLQNRYGINKGPYFEARVPPK